VRRASRAAFVLAAVFALLDLWQVAILRPGFLSAASVLLLLAMYLGAAFVAVMALLAAAMLRRGRDVAPAVPGVFAVLFATGGFLMAEEAVLAVLPPRSPWRAPSVLILALAAAGSIAPLAAACRRTRPSRRAIAAACVLLLLGGAGAAGGLAFPRRHATASPRPSGSTAARPSILLITIDTLRVDHVSCYGYARATTPAIDAFAREAVLFTQAFAQSSLTKPSTASLLTSHYPTMHRTNLRTERIPEAEVLLPEVLRDHGYATAALSGNPWVTADYGFAQGVDDFYSAYDERFARATLLMQAVKRVNQVFDHDARLYNFLKRCIQGSLSNAARDAELGAEAGRWLQRQQAPAFAYVHFFSPHHAYEPPPPFDRTFVRTPLDPPVAMYPEKSWVFFERGAPLAEDRREDMIGRYDGEILWVDTVVGKLLDSLRSAGLLDRMVVVITADHGEEFYDHENWGHGHSLYNELLHVPLIVRYPAVLPMGKRIDEVVRSVDVMPTILELGDVPAPAGLVGRSLVPLMQGEPWTPLPAYAELINRFGEGRAFIAGGKKLIEVTMGGTERRVFYDLGADPAEARDLMNDRADALVYEQQLAAVHAWAAQRRIDAALTRPSDEMKRRLDALGYVN